MPFKILVVDDEINDRHNDISRLPEMLHAAGYEVVTTPDGGEAYDLVLTCKPDLILLDIEFKNQPEDGFGICASIRLNDPEIPIILITVPKAETKYVLEGFEAGANDYVIRPRDNREIIARIRANLPPEVFTVDDYLCVDLAGFQTFVRREGKWQEIHLARLEFELLKVLIMKDGLIAPTTVLKSKLWEDMRSDDVLAVYISRLRKKIEPDPAHPKYVEMIKGFGYRFNGKQVHTSRRSCGC